MPTETVTVTTAACMFCGATSEVELTAAQFDLFIQRRPVQEVLPDVEPEVRELLISGTHPACWFGMFGANE
ncbi:hypothetical protein [Microbacterium sp. NPDC055683]